MTHEAERPDTTLAALVVGFAPLRHVTAVELEEARRYA